MSECMSPNRTVSVDTHSDDETRAFGRKIAARLEPGSVVLLEGDLGAGKTTLVQGICHGLGVDAWANSPTFTLINEYVGNSNGTELRVYHCDFYRIDDPDELQTLAIDEVFYGDGISLVEWPDVAAEWAPPHAVRIAITRTGAEDRHIRVEQSLD